MILRYLRTVRHAKRPTSPRGASPPGAQHTPRLGARVHIAKTKNQLKAMRKLIKIEQTPSTVDADVQRGFHGTLKLCIFVRVDLIAEEQ